MIRRTITAIVLLAVVSVGATAGWIVLHAVREDLARTDAIVVLGAAQFDGQPSPVLRNRLNRVQDLYREKVADFIVTVGGKRPGDRYTEASAGRQYLESQGIASDRIKSIGVGSDTYSSLIAVARYAENQGWKSITIVTDRMHVARSDAIMASLGFAVHSAPPTKGPGSALTWRYLVRETGGLLRFWLLRIGGQSALA